jgi:hypothetical protein
MKADQMPEQVFKGVRQRGVIQRRPGHRCLVCAQPAGRDARMGVSTPSCPDSVQSKYQGEDNSGNRETQRRQFTRADFGAPGAGQVPSRVNANGDGELIRACTRGLVRLPRTGKPGTLVVLAGLAAARSGKLNTRTLPVRTPE